MSDLLYEYADKILLELKLSVENYLNFVTNLTAFANNGIPAKHIPLSDDVTYVMDMLGDYDSSLLLCYLCVGESETLITLVGGSRRKLKKEIKRIQRVVKNSDFKKYILDRDETAVVFRDSEGVPVQIADIGFPPSLVKLLNNNGIKLTNQLKKIPWNTLTSIEGITDDQLNTLVTFMKVNHLRMSILDSNDAL